MNARLPGLYRLDVANRLRALEDAGCLSAADRALLTDSGQMLSVEAADTMVENVIGVFGLPLGLALNFQVNGADYVVPMVVEEPSIVAGVSSAAKLARIGGGFVVSSDAPHLIGQIQLVEVAVPARAQARILQARQAILDLANSLHPKMVARGGGARDVEVRLFPDACALGDMLVVHLVVDTCDAMGANLVNTMCEGVAPLLEQLTDGKVFLRILSNLTDRAMVRARARFTLEALAQRGAKGETVRDGILLAYAFAACDPYRATTHNKGIMNGIDAVALATGNDWRAIEAAAHAYAGRGERYTSLSHWSEDDDGSLVGELVLPLKVGTVGGSLRSNPAVPLCQRLLGVSSARTLAEIMGAVGLAQNFAALRALASEGIQQGHMTLHARSVVTAAAVPSALFDQVVERVIASGEVKEWKAREIAARLTAQPAVEEAPHDVAIGHAKVILMGEHAVLYGSHAISAPLALTVGARIEAAGEAGDVRVVVPAWGVQGHLRRLLEANGSLYRSLDLILRKLGLNGRGMTVAIYPNLPRAMGLGGSAALAVAVVRALSQAFNLNLADPEVNALAFAAEQEAHGQASGVDNSTATFARMLLYRAGPPVLMRHLMVPKPLPVVIGLTGVESLTAGTVARVRRVWLARPARYEGLFADIDALTLQAVTALEAGQLDELGELMNINQGLLNALQLSSPELEDLIGIARRHGAVGAKLTGGGGGGAMLALCPGGSESMLAAMRRAGYRAMATTLAAVPAALPPQIS